MSCHHRYYDNGDGLLFIGRTGNLALADFPHARENCATCPFAADPLKTCTNCYCYVCDAAATSCPKWVEHCGATHKQPRWRMLREQWRKAADAPSSVVPPTVSPVWGQAGPRVPLLPAGSSSTQATVWSCERIMKAVEQVYPVEAAPPAGFVGTLRPYQAQSLAFMYEIEVSTDPTLQGTAEKAVVPRGGRLTDEVGMGKPVPRGGWLADEMGMGKTAVCAGKP